MLGTKADVLPLGIGMNNEPTDEDVSKSTKYELAETTEYGTGVDTIVKADQISFKDQTEYNEEQDKAKALSAKIQSAQEAGSYSIIKSKLDEEARQARMDEQLSMIVQHTGDTAVATKEHSISWDSIFSKKGLITGALLLAIPLLLELLISFLIADVYSLIISLIIDLFTIMITSCILSIIKMFSRYKTAKKINPLLYIKLLCNEILDRGIISSLQSNVMRRRRSFAGTKDLHMYIK